MGDFRRRKEKEGPWVISGGEEKGRDHG